MKPLSINIIAVSLIAGTAMAQEPVWDANTVVLESQELAEGIFAVIPTGAENMGPQGFPMATSGGFVIGDNYVLVVESMLNERLND
ncbi:MAG: hypothetical protein OTI35_17120 [Sulfitobacter sp.]|nr:hypothetical protein [Sulfitobacter sp.]